MKKTINLISFVAIFLLSNIVLFAQTSTNQLKIEGLKQEVIVRRDGRGIPYIEAKNEESS